MKDEGTTQRKQRVHDAPCFSARLPMIWIASRAVLALHRTRNTQRQRKLTLPPKAAQTASPLERNARQLRHIEQRLAACAMQQDAQSRK